MDAQRAEKLSLIAAIATMIAWGVNFAVMKYVLAATGVGPFLFIRFLVMPALGFALLLFVYRRHLAKALPRRADWPRFIAAGLIGHTAHVGIVTWGIDLSTAFSSSLVLTSGPLFTLLILVLLGVERLGRQQLAGSLLAFVGIAVFLSDKFAEGFSRAGAGDLVLLFASALFSVYTVISKPLVERYGPLPLLVWTLAVGAPPLVLLSLPSFLAAPLTDLPAAVWLGLAWSAVISNFLGWLVWVWVNTVRGVARSAPLMYLMPPIAGVIAWLGLGEQFTALKLGGAALTMAGVAWAQLSASPRERNTVQPDPG